MFMCRASGFSLIEALVALGIMATVSAALLPAITLASRLHRDSASETSAAVLGAAHVARLTIAVASSSMSSGGSIDESIDGWRQHTDAAGAEAGAGNAVFEVRWQVSNMPHSAGVMLVAVRVVPLATPTTAVTLTAVVPRA